jgi:hypothetical protein
MEKFYRQVLERCGVTTDVYCESSRLYFSLDGYCLDIYLNETCWMNLGVSFWGTEKALLSKNHFQISPNERQRLLAIVNDLNRRTVYVRFSLHEASYLVIEWSNFLFGRVSPNETETDLPELAVEDILSSFVLGIDLLSGAAINLFDRIGIEGYKPQWRLPNKPPLKWNSSLQLFTSALETNGIKYFEINPSEHPKLGFFWDDRKLLIYLYFPGHQVGGYSLAIRFIEQDRFELNRCVDNVICGVIDPILIEIVNDCNVSFFGYKFMASLEDGDIIVSLAGCLPVRTVDRVSSILPALAQQLFMRAETLLEATGLPAHSFSVENDRLQQVDTGEKGLLMLHLKTCNPFEFRTAQVLRDRVLGHYGYIMSGYVIPASGGEVEIDCIIVCESGIFVIECKSYSGRIKGSRNSNWHQTYQKHSRKIDSRGINPAAQVTVQVFALKMFLQQHAQQSTLFPQGFFIIGAVVFPENAELTMQNIPINHFQGWDPAAFTLDQLAIALQQVANSRTRLTPAQIDTIRHWIDLA